MANPETNLRVRITGDLADIKAGLVTLQRDLAGVKRSASQSLGENNAFVSGLRRARQELGGIVAGFLSIQGLRTFARLSDQAATLQGRLRLATRSQAEFARAQRDTFDIAQRNQVQLETSIDLYGRLGRATAKLGLGQGSQSALTETILQAGRLSFASPEALNAAIVQLGQGLSSGRLGGEELNSVLEQTPRLAQAIQDGLREIGIKGSENLRKLAKEGVLTPEVIVRALLTQQQKLAAESAKLPDTIAGQFTRISNAVLKFINDSNQANSAAQTIIQFLKAIAENLPVIASLLTTGAKIAVAYFAVFRAAPAAIALATGALKLYRDQVIATSLAQTLGIKTATTWATRLKAGAALVFSAFAGWQIGKYLREQFLEVEIAGYALVSGLLKSFERLKGGVEIAWLGIKAAILGAINIIRNQVAGTLENMAAAAERIDVFGLSATSIARARNFASALRTGESAFDDFAAAAGRVATETEGKVAQIESTMLELVEAATLARQATDEVAGGGEGEGVVGTGDGGAAKAAADRLALLRDAVERAIRELDRLYAEGELSFRQYFAEKARLETEGIDLAIRQAQEELRVADTTAEQSRALTEIIKLQRDRAEIGPRVAREQAAAEKALGQELQELSIRLLELQGNTEAATIARLGEQFRVVRERLVREGNATGLAVLDAVFNREILSAKLQGFQTQMQEALGRLRTAETSIAAQLDAGGLGPSEAERQLQDVRSRSLAQLQQLRQSVVDYYNATKDPTVLQFLQELDGSIAQVAASQQQFRQDIQDSAINSLTNLFTDLVSGAKKGKEALRDFVVGFVQSMAQIAARALATYLVLRLLDAIYPGLGKATAAGMSAAANVKHGGGIAGEGGTIRAGLSPLLFGAAPRYHGGGIAGLAPDEVPAVLRKGEEVLTEEDERHRKNIARAGAGGGRVKQPVVAIGERAIADALAGAAGEEIVLTHVRANWGGLSRGDGG